jgi:predicted RNA-binding Zn ribbon-like protein
MREVGVLQLRHPDGRVFAFDPGSLSFAFAVTGGPSDEAVYAKFETLHAATDIAPWAEDVIGAAGITSTDDDLARARELRAAIWHGAWSAIGGRQLAAADRRILNAFAAAPPLRPHLGPSDGRTWATPADVPALLSTIARDAIEVFGGPAASRIRQCEGAKCALLFVDTSRSGGRRWCSMDRCGNRAKVSAHRHRQRQEVSR